MKILDIINSPWAIMPDSLSHIINVYNAFLDGEKLDFNALLIEKREKDKQLNVQNGKAIIPIKGPVTKGSFFSFFFESRPMEYIKGQIQQALDDPDVESIILDIDSPGGTVDGSFELADFIVEAKKEKQIETFSDGMIASAAYLFAASTDKITISGKTNVIGSIGVIYTHADYSEQDKRYGISMTEIVSGKFKNTGSYNFPLSELAQQTIQDRVDYLASIFFTDVSDRRQMNIESIIKMEANIFIGQQAIDVGLADNVGTLDEMIYGTLQSNSGNDSGALIHDSIKTYSNHEPSDGNDLINSQPERKSMDRETLRTEHQELYNTIVNSARKEGAIEQRERDTEIASASFPGQEELVRTLVNNVDLSVKDAIVQLNQDQKDKINVEVEKIQADRPKEVQVVKTQDVETLIEQKEKPEEKDFMTIVHEIKHNRNISTKDAMSEAVMKHPVEYKNFLKQ